MRCPWGPQSNISQFVCIVPVVVFLASWGLNHLYFSAYNKIIAWCCLFSGSFCQFASFLGFFWPFEDRWAWTASLICTAMNCYRMFMNDYSRSKMVGAIIMEQGRQAKFQAKFQVISMIANHLLSPPPSPLALATQNQYFLFICVVLVAFTYSMPSRVEFFYIHNKNKNTYKNNNQSWIDWQCFFERNNIKYPRFFQT